MRIKKISVEQFVLDCINKEFEIVNSGLHFKSMQDLKVFSKEHPHWFLEYEFTLEQNQEWEEYFMKHFYDCYPTRISKKEVKRECSYFSLCYGFTLKQK